MQPMGTSIHFLFNQDGWRIACMPGMRDLNQSQINVFMRTEDPRAVTCQSCKSSSAYKVVSANVR